MTFIIDNELSQLVIIKIQDIEKVDRTPIHKQENSIENKYIIYSDKGEIEIKIDTKNSSNISKTFELKCTKGDIFKHTENYDYLHDAIKAAKRYLE